MGAGDAAGGGALGADEISLAVGTPRTLSLDLNFPRVYDIRGSEERVGASVGRVGAAAAGREEEDAPRSFDTSCSKLLNSSWASSFAMCDGAYDVGGGIEGAALKDEEGPPRSL